MNTTTTPVLGAVNPVVNVMALTDIQSDDGAEQLEMAPLQPQVPQCSAIQLHVLDKAKALQWDTFPNRPRKEGIQIPPTIPNVGFLLTSYGIIVRYNVIKKKLVITMPGHSGSQDNFDNVAMTQILSLASLNGMPNGPIPAIVDSLGDRNLLNPVAD